MTNKKTTPIPTPMSRLPAITASLEYVRAATMKPRLEVQQLQMLMTLFEYPQGINMQDLAKKMTADPSFVSRNAKAFGSGSQGKRLISMRVDDMNPRYRLLSLTDDGRAMLEMVLAVSEGRAEPPKVRPPKDARCKD